MLANVYTTQYSSSNNSFITPNRAMSGFNGRYTRTYSPQLPQVRRGV